MARPTGRSVTDSYFLGFNVSNSQGSVFFFFFLYVKLPWDNWTDVFVLFSFEPTASLGSGIALGPVLLKFSLSPEKLVPTTRLVFLFLFLNSFLHSNMSSVPTSWSFDHQYLWLFSSSLSPAFSLSLHLSLFLSLFLVLLFITALNYT